MSRKHSYFVTFDDAVARMINFDYIPEGFSLLDMTDAFREDADVAYENGQLDPSSAEDLDRLRDRLDACDSRHTLAMALLERIEKESNDPDSDLDFDLPPEGTPRVSLTSLSDWASNNFGIGFAFNDVNQAPQPKWEDVTIKVYADYRLGWKVAGGKFHWNTFQKIGLMGKRKLKPNACGLVLLKLAQGAGRVPYQAGNARAKLMSDLRAALKRLTGIAASPFLRTTGF